MKTWRHPQNRKYIHIPLPSEEDGLTAKCNKYIKHVVFKIHRHTNGQTDTPITRLHPLGGEVKKVRLDFVITSYNISGRETTNNNSAQTSSRRTWSYTTSRLYLNSTLTYSTMWEETTYFHYFLPWFVRRGTGRHEL